MSNASWQKRCGMLVLNMFCQRVKFIYDQRNYGLFYTANDECESNLSSRDKRSSSVNQKKFEKISKVKNERLSVFSCYTTYLLRFQFSSASCGICYFFFMTRFFLMGHEAPTRIWPGVCRVSQQKYIK